MILYNMGGSRDGGGGSRDGGGGSSFAFGVAGFTVDGIARFCCIFRCLPPFFVAVFTLTYNLS